MANLRNTIDRLIKSGDLVNINGDFNPIKVRFIQRERSYVVVELPAGRQGKLHLDDIIFT